ncbi:T9SS C-terminal target domain-containing protein [Rhodohalobacter sp. SW132]|uniref:T9SS type A sorting domain-containing protein n=1 Tax=Rhodohalobacter sp. SW132 TaxID=2293433 RepID=UPI000E25315B|nr:T9SS type A sorting domain-containing protein [Rhodohalobacter sp. SW132]REL32818.1 T9SS C-terminal target domain-containing protein [Rhodohalobacter sp. SW132]
MKKIFNHFFVLTVLAFCISDIAEAQNGWTPIGIPGEGTVYSIVPLNDRLYVSGRIITYDEDANKSQPIAIYSLDTNSWSPFYKDLYNGVNSSWIKDLQIHENTLYMGGDFTNIVPPGDSPLSSDGFTSNRFAGINIDDNEWLDVGVSELRLSAIKTFAIWNEAVFTGASVGNRHFNNENDTYMAAGNLESRQWSALDPGIDNTPRDHLVVDDKLYIGGRFSEMEEEPAGGMIVYDLITQEWQPLITSLRYGSVRGFIEAMAVHDGNIYVGGTIHELNDISVRGVAVYNIEDETWSTLPFNISGTVSALHIADGILYIGGSFDSIFTGEHPDIIRERGSRNLVAYRISDGAYSNLGELGTTGSSSTVYAITSHENSLYVGGSFNEMEGEESHGLALFDLDYLDFKFLGGEATSSDIRDSDLPDEIALTQNYPNPFNPTTTIEYALPERTDVRLEVFNMLGQRVALLADEQKTAGWHTVNFDASALSSGIYLYRIQAGGFTETRKLTLMK